MSHALLLALALAPQAGPAPATRPTRVYVYMADGVRSYAYKDFKVTLSVITVPSLKDEVPFARGVKVLYGAPAGGGIYIKDPDSWHCRWPGHPKWVVSLALTRKQAERLERLLSKPGRALLITDSEMPRPKHPGIKVPER
jgi:hypothetical protein